MISIFIRRGMGRRDIYNRRVCYLVTSLIFASIFFIAGFYFLGISDYYYNYQYTYTVCFIYGAIQCLCALCMFRSIKNMKANVDTIVLQPDKSYQQPYGQQPYPTYPQNQYPQQQYQYPNQQYPHKYKPKQLAKMTVPTQTDPNPLITIEKVANNL